MTNNITIITTKHHSKFGNFITQTNRQQWTEEIQILEKDLIRYAHHLHLPEWKQDIRTDLADLTREHNQLTKQEGNETEEYKNLIDNITAKVETAIA